MAQDYDSGDALSDADRRLVDYVAQAEELCDMGMSTAKEAVERVWERADVDYDSLLDGVACSVGSCLDLMSFDQAIASGEYSSLPEVERESLRDGIKGRLDALNEDLGVFVSGPDDFRVTFAGLKTIDGEPLVEDGHGPYLSLFQEPVEGSELELSVGEFGDLDTFDVAERFSSGMAHALYPLREAVVVNARGTAVGRLREDSVVSLDGRGKTDVAADAISPLVGEISDYVQSCDWHRPAPGSYNVEAYEGLIDLAAKGIRAREDLRDAYVREVSEDRASVPVARADVLRGRHFFKQAFGEGVSGALQTLTMAFGSYWVGKESLWGDYEENPDLEIRDDGVPLAYFDDPNKVSSSIPEGGPALTFDATPTPGSMNLTVRNFGSLEPLDVASRLSRKMSELGLLTPSFEVFDAHGVAAGRVDEKGQAVKFAEEKPFHSRIVSGGSTKAIEDRSTDGLDF